jgi:hypothetical protein
MLEKRFADLIFRKTVLLRYWLLSGAPKALDKSSTASRAMLR